MTSSKSSGSQPPNRHERRKLKRTMEANAPSTAWTMARDRNFFRKHKHRQYYLRESMPHERAEWLAAGKPLRDDERLYVIVHKLAPDRRMRVSFPHTPLKLDDLPSEFHESTAAALFEAITTRQRYAVAGGVQS